MHHHALVYLHPETLISLFGNLSYGLSSRQAIMTTSPFLAVAMVYDLPRVWQLPLNVSAGFQSYAVLSSGSKKTDPINELFLLP